MSTLSDEQKANIEREVIEEYKQELKSKFPPEVEKKDVKEEVNLPMISKDLIKRVIIAGLIFMTFRFGIEVYQQYRFNKIILEEQVITPTIIAQENSEEMLPPHHPVELEE